MGKPKSALAKTKAQISFAVTVQTHNHQRHCSHPCASWGWGHPYDCVSHQQDKHHIYLALWAVMLAEGASLVTGSCMILYDVGMDGISNGANCPSGNKKSV